MILMILGSSSELSFLSLSFGFRPIFGDNMGAVYGNLKFVLESMCKRLSKMDIEDVRAVASEEFITIAGTGRWKDNGGRALFGLRVLVNEKVHLSGFTCSFKDEKELIEIATSPIIPDVNFPDYVALIMGYRGAVELWLKVKGL